MPHIHEKFDFVVSAFIVCDTHVALVHHKKIGCWLPIGGHIELDETPDEALAREIKEEFGQEVGKEVRMYQSVEDSVHTAMIISHNDHHNAMTLLRPWSVEVHDYPGYPGHRHIALVYLAATSSPHFVLSSEHNCIMWFDHERLDNKIYDVPERIRAYGHAALKVFDIFSELR